MTVHLHPSSLSPFSPFPLQLPLLPPASLPLRTPPPPLPLVGGGWAPPSRYPVRMAPHQCRVCQGGKAQQRKPETVTADRAPWREPSWEWGFGARAPWILPWTATGDKGLSKEQRTAIGGRVLWRGRSWSLATGGRVLWRRQQEHSRQVFLVSVSSHQHDRCQSVSHCFMSQTSQASQ